MNLPPDVQQLLESLLALQKDGQFPATRLDLSVELHKYAATLSGDDLTQALTKLVDFTRLDGVAWSLTITCGHHGPGWGKPPAVDQPPPAPSDK